MIEEHGNVSQVRWPQAAGYLAVIFGGDSGAPAVLESNREFVAVPGVCDNADPIEIAGRTDPAGVFARWN